MSNQNRYVTRRVLLNVYLSRFSIMLQVQ